MCIIFDFQLVEFSLLNSEYYAASVADTLRYLVR